MPDALQNLPPEMQARLASIMQGQQQQAAPQQPQQPVPAQQAQIQKPPSLMDHLLALRQEVAALRTEVRANSDVVEAVGQAVGSLYGMFQQTPQPNAQGPTFSQGFQQETVDESDY